MTFGYDYYHRVFDRVYAITSSSPTMPVTGTISSFSKQSPVINDPSLKAEPIFQGNLVPSSMAFLGPNDILLLQKNNGTIVRIVNGSMLSKPLLQVNVATEAERGLLGIATAKTSNSTKNGSAAYVFLYYTESSGGKTGDDITGHIKLLDNRLYRYELVDNKLINPKLLLSLPAKPGPFHNGGKVIIGYDNNLYVVIGDVFGNGTKVQNFENGTDPDGRGGILRITQDGKPVAKGILGDKFPLNLYYAYGIRNSFGIDFDPVSKMLWDTENGPDYGDEINLVEPGFNSGWKQVQGVWRPNGDEAGPAALHPNDLVVFNGKGKYHAPQFTWFYTIGPTGIKFLSSAKLGKQYENDVFVGDFNNGILYHFKLNRQRNGLLLNGSLANKIASYGHLNMCDFIFRCIFNSGNSSIQISTNSTSDNTWSWIYGKEISVRPEEQYQLVTHMKLNKFATQSHIVVEGYNVTSKTWDEITQCPSGTNGSLEWKEYRCDIIVPVGTNRIRPILNAGWSSQHNEQAITLFEALYLHKEIRSCLNKTCMNETNGSNIRLAIDRDPLREVIFGHGFGDITDIQVGPDGYLYVLSAQDENTRVTEGSRLTIPIRETIYRIAPVKD